MMAVLQVNPKGGVMFVPLLLSSVAAGLIATGVMVFFLYLPLTWRGSYYDVLGALGSAITRRVDAQARFLGGLIYFAGGIFFAVFYGWATLSLLRLNYPLPQLNVFPGLPVEVNLFYPLLGAVVGLGHGILVAFILTIIVIEHHPLEQFRSRFILVVSQIISHVAFGATVMFFHSQFLQLLTSPGGA